VDGSLRALLEGAGFRVEMQRSFGEVREAVRSTVPDILIVHSRSGLGPELAFYASLRSVLEKRFVPLVVMAESITQDEEVMALSAGVDAVVTGAVPPDAAGGAAPEPPAHQGPSRCARLGEYAP